MTADPFVPVVLALGSLTLHVLPYGLTLHRLLLRDRAGAEVHDLLVGPEEPADHRDAGRDFFGPLVGRYANRLPAGISTYEAGPGGKTEEVTLPEWGGDAICHHGGPSIESTEERPGSSGGPFDRAIWASIPRSQSSFFASDGAASDAEALFALESPHGANGFPGFIRVEALVALLPPSEPSASHSSLGHSAGRVILQYRAALLDDGVGQGVSATPLNLTQHWGFNLSASSPRGKTEGGRVDEHTLRLFPTSSSAGIRLLDLDSHGLPTGKLLPISHEDTHDWTPAGQNGTGKRIRKRMPEDGYDRYYCWGGAAESLPAPSHATLAPRAPQAVLASPSTGLSIEFTTNQSGLQLYTTEHLSPSPSPAPAGRGARKALHCQGGPHDGAPNAKRSAAAIEFSHPHATFLHPELRQAAGTDTLLRRTIDGGAGYDNWVQAEIWER